MQPTEWAHAQDWIADTLAGHGTPAVGPAVVERDRPWSRVAWVPVLAGRVWFKRSSPGTAYEPRLTRLLGGLVPDQVVVPIAVVADRGWMLLPDGGPTMREACGETVTIDQWTQLMRSYAELQRVVAGHCADLIGAGVPDLRPDRIPEHFARLVEDDHVVSQVRPDQLAQLRTWQPRLERLCAGLAASGVPATIQHDDLHPGNVFVGARGEPRFFDFGDASVAHPFGSMLVALRVVADQTKVPHGDPLLHHLRDTYLAAWTGGRDLAELRRICQDAIVVTKVSKALSYQRALLGADEAAMAGYGDSIHGWLTELLGPDVI